MNDPAFEAALEIVRQEVASLGAGLRDLPVTSLVPLPAVRERVNAAFPLQSARSLPDITRDTIALLREHSLHVTHPRYFGLFNPSVHPSAIIADALVALFNPQVAGWSHAPAANELEGVVLRRVASALGMPPGATAAHFTSGGNEANHTAVVARLAYRYVDWAKKGVRALPRPPVIYLSAEAHHSFVKIARATGLGTQALRHVPVDVHLRMIPYELEAMIEHDRREGLDPMMLVATAGTTGAGAIDPLPRLAEIAAREGLWMHVDAAWGGAAAFSPALQHALHGIEEADSVTLDAHKWLSVPLGCGIFVCRHPAALQSAFGVDTGYVPPTEDGAVDLYKHSMQWSRRFMGLKLLFAMAEQGPEGTGKLLEHQARMADRLRESLVSGGWHVVNDTVLPLVCFTHAQLPQDEIGLRRVVDQILARGKVWVSTVRLPGRNWAIRACITSYQTTQEDLEVLMAEVELARQSQ